jgi:hypothetical protein
MKKSTNMTPLRALALLCQIFAARSIVAVAMPPLNRLTEQAQLPFRESSKASASRPWSSEGFRSGLAASQVAASLNWPIVIWYGEELTA